MYHMTKVASVGQGLTNFETSSLTLYIPLDDSVNFQSRDTTRGVYLSKGFHGCDEGGLWMSEVLVVV